MTSKLGVGMWTHLLHLLQGLEEVLTKAQYQN
jgi:hypothetical protein